MRDFKFIDIIKVHRNVTGPYRNLKELADPIY